MKQVLALVQESWTLNGIRKPSEESIYSNYTKKLMGSKARFQVYISQIGNEHKEREFRKSSRLTGELKNSSGNLEYSKELTLFEAKGV